jgi:peptidyl-prolyl cis-trans isomerase B (cyclophilin B)
MAEKLPLFYGIRHTRKMNRTASLWIIIALLTACKTAPTIKPTYPQVPKEVLIELVEAEDTRTWKSDMVKLLSNPNPNVRSRTALAAGRIGEQSAIPELIKLLKQTDSTEVAAMAAFALGEIESPAAVPSLLETLKYSPLLETLKLSDEKSIRAAAVEALGKIAAALPENDAVRKRIGTAILDVLKEQKTAKHVHHDVIARALTAAVRAKPEGASAVIAMYLDWDDAEVLDSLARLRAKESLDRVRELLVTSGGPSTRANAARMLGAAGDTLAVGALEKTMATDVTLPPRVESIRALASIAQRRSVEPLLKRADALLASKPLSAVELREIAVALEHISPNSNDRRQLEILDRIRKARGKDPEMNSAIARTGPPPVKWRNTRQDYERAVARIGKSPGVILKTDKGDITIQFLPDVAPLTVDSFIRLAESHYFDGLAFDLATPNVMIQTGDPRSNGKGRAVYSIRCEINPVDFGELIVGMANSGKDTGGAQFFITQSRQSHLDGINTAFARVIDGGWEVVPTIERGDRIRSVTIVEDVWAKYRNARRN